MRILRFRIDDRPTYGVMNEGESRIVGLKGDPLFSQIEPSGQIYQFDQVVPLAPVIPRSKLVIARPDAKQPDQFSFTIKPNTAVVGPQDPVMVPAWACQLKVEPMLGVVIKSLVKGVKLGEVEDLIAGYTVVNNFSAGSNLLWDTSCPLGPWISLQSDFDPGNWQASVQVTGAGTGFAESAQGEDECRPAPGAQGDSAEETEEAKDGAAGPKPDAEGQSARPAPGTQGGSAGETTQGAPEHQAVDPLLAVYETAKVMTLLPGDLVLVGNPQPLQFPVRLGQTVTTQISGIGELDNRIFPEQ